MSGDGALDRAADVAPQAEQGSGFWQKLKRGLFMTHTELLGRVGAAMEGRAFLDDATVEALEEALIAADVGAATAAELVERVRRRARRADGTTPLRLREVLGEEMAQVLLEAPAPPPVEARPRVTLVVGVNGVGKTTSIAKLARRSQRRGEGVLIAAADTFRAAAAEQLQVWGDRLGVQVIRQQQGADPAAVVFDALRAAAARGVDHLLVDTAGRLHTKDHLMAELAKVRRVIEREAPGWGRPTLLVLDATTGQNAVAQARQFAQVAGVDGVLLAKIDGTAKGGVVVAIARELGLPVLYLGVGESADDLVEFRPREFAAALLG